MFDTSVIAQSAISAFNNAALWAPLFFWVGILMMPVMWLAYVGGGELLSRVPRLNWATPKSRDGAIALIFAGTMLGWLILMGGNYSVLRDGVSWLPVGIAGVMFGLAAYFTAMLRPINPPLPGVLARRPRAARAGLVLSMGVIAGLFGGPGIWGFILQFAAVVGGVIFGSVAPARLTARPVGACTVLMLLITVLILMQPEFFRFGQLDNLTIVHMLFLIAIGACGAAIGAVSVIRPCRRIHESAYRKLKWMMRVACVLCMALFCMTESVPLYIATIGVFGIMFAMSVFHSESVPATLSARIWAIMLVLFGVMTITPSISLVGLAYLAAMPRGNTARMARFLL